MTKHIQKFIFKLSKILSWYDNSVFTVDFRQVFVHRGMSTKNEYLMRLAQWVKMLFSESKILPFATPLDGSVRLRKNTVF